MLPHDPGGALQVEAGEVIVVPQGETHLLGSATDVSPELMAPLLTDQVETRPGEVMTLAYGGGGAVTRMVCGFLTAQEICGIARSLRCARAHTNACTPGAPVDGGRSRQPGRHVTFRPRAAFRGPARSSADAIPGAMALAARRAATSPWRPIARVGRGGRRLRIRSRFQSRLQAGVRGAACHMAQERRPSRKSRKRTRERRRIGQHCVGLTRLQQLRHGTRVPSRSGFDASPARTAPPANGCFGANWPARLIGSSWPNSDRHAVSLAHNSGQAKPTRLGETSHDCAYSTPATRSSPVSVNASGLIAMSRTSSSSGSLSE